jgi:hypothetical protein
VTHLIRRKIFSLKQCFKSVQYTLSTSVLLDNIS